jgi:hypothetical protein
MPTTPADRRLQASAAANTRWAFTDDRSAATASARKALSDRFEKQVDPDGTLSPDERARRAASARRAHMQRLALKSARSRRAAASARARAQASHKTASDLEHSAADLEQEAADADAELDGMQAPARDASQCSPEQ